MHRPFAHIPGVTYPPPPKPRRKSPRWGRRRAQMTPEERDTIIRLHNEGMRVINIAKVIRCDKRHVSATLREAGICLSAGPRPKQ